MQDEDGITEDSLSGDDEDQRSTLKAGTASSPESSVQSIATSTAPSDAPQGGTLSCFLPAVIPRMPHDLGLPASGVQVAQVHHDTCITQESAGIAHRHAASSQQRCCAP